MSRLHASTGVLVAVLVTGGSTMAVAQTPANTIALPAKLDVEGLSQMLIPIGIHGHTFWCSADSGGSRVLSLDISKARRVGLEPNATGSSAGVGPEVNRDQRLRGATITLGSLAIRDITIVLVPRPTVVPDIDCVLGLGLLPDYAVAFDYVTPAVRLTPTVEFHPTATATAIPMSIDRTATPSIKARLTADNGLTVDATLMVDTGASYYDVVLLKPFVDAHRLTDHVGAIVRRYSDTPGMTLSAARMTAASVGPFEISGPVAAMIATASSGTFTVDGLLGAGFLRRFNVTFDFSRGRLWLEPNGRTRGPQAFDASGIDLRPTDTHDFAIVAVEADSAGDRAGLQVGDLLSEINGRRASDLTLGEIQDQLNHSGATCTMRVQRNGEVRVVTLRLLRRL